MWYKLNKMSRSAANEISADIHVPSDSPWFDGHFPGDPILPGVAQIAMVFDAIRKAYNRELKLSGVRRVRFKGIIRPDDRLNIIAAPLKQETGSYSFRILIQDETVCSGVMAVENQKEFKTSIPEEEEKN
jgi:3-hydroxymyristoyl/3-hydroxydecanoyl-(acyl carrier protein) dehydratase